jgi:hypothetical protein
MWYWIEGILCIFAGGALGYLFGQKVQDVSEYAFMTAKGYVKRGEDWIKSHV